MVDMTLNIHVKEEIALLNFFGIPSLLSSFQYMKAENFRIKPESSDGVQRKITLKVFSCVFLLCTI